MANTIYSDLQQLSQPSPWVSLFTLDTTALGGTIYRFTPNIYANGTYLSFANNTYMPLPMDFTGWEVMASTTGGQGAMPRPQLSVSNANKTLLAVVISLGDLVGATLTRVRTFQKYLDGQPNANTAQIIGPDVFTIAQKTSHTNQQIVWQMTNPMDIPTAKLPARQILKDPSTLSAGFPGVQVYSGTNG
jgi:lambda family phage minor tail protein L